MQADHRKPGQTAREPEPHRHRGKFTENLLDKNLVLEALGVKTGQIILDAGCGNGYMARAFWSQMEQTGKVYALDTDKVAIEALCKASRGSHIMPLIGDISGVTPVPAATLDLLYISAVIHGFSKSRMTGFIAEARRLLKPGATLAIVEIEKKETPFGPPLAIRFSPEELIEAIPLLPAGTRAVGEHFYMQLFTNQMRK